MTEFRNRAEGIDEFLIRTVGIQFVYALGTIFVDDERFFENSSVQIGRTPTQLDQVSRNRILYDFKTSARSIDENRAAISKSPKSLKFGDFQDKS